ncbi:MAG: nucleotide sugar dehydrogenase [Candidatus Schekmanbacteria bacterium]|nr:nucleotide sugar dehydrogenase [Candidatus Schekmanbacteria bacterium]
MTPNKLAENLMEKIKHKQANIGFIGLGYVGLPWTVEFARMGFHVWGIDIDKEKVDNITKGISYIPDVPTMDLAQVVKSGHFQATTDFSCIRNLDTINICVPTPLRKTKDPDVSFIDNAANEIAKYIKPGQLIILESTSYPGTTEELVMPIITKTGLEVGKDIFLAFSPERVDPGNKVHTPRNVPKVVGGVSSYCTEAACELYKSCLTQVVPVSSPKVAEMVKLLENTFRIVNIGLVNEIALLSSRLGMNVWEVIDAAKSKPFGFMPFYPGPGLGGHCIPVDPFYLSWKARSLGFEARFIELAGEINGQMPHHVVNLIADALNERGKCIKGSNIHIIGVAYKKDINDVRESPSIDIVDVLHKKGAKISYTDPYVPQLKIEALNERFISRPLDNQLLKSADCVVIITDHSCIDYASIVANASLIIDTRNALKNYRSEKIVTL